MLSILRIS